MDAHPGSPAFSNIFHIAAIRNTERASTISMNTMPPAKSPSIMSPRYDCSDGLPRRATTRTESTRKVTIRLRSGEEEGRRKGEGREKEGRGKKREWGRG